jgi:endonuclease YncB( thermonuclease family)
MPETVKGARAVTRAFLAPVRVVAAAIALCGVAAGITVSGQVRALVGTHFEARVVSIVDGDTFDAVPLDSTGSIRIRLDGIDTPEWGEPFSSAATRSARVLLFDQRVTVEGRDVDRYGRLVARVTVRGDDASTALLLAGLACHYLAYSSDVTLANAEAEARLHRRGFWAQGVQTPRCATEQLRNAEAQGSRAGPVIYHGNTSSHVYHAPSCRNYNCRNCTRAFASEAEARGAGFRPAGDCLSGSP